jgi:hypothetical protein
MKILLNNEIYFPLVALIMLNISLMLILYCLYELIYRILYLNCTKITNTENQIIPINIDTPKPIKLVYQPTFKVKIMLMIEFTGVKYMLKKNRIFRME